MRRTITSRERRAAHDPAARLHLADARTRLAALLLAADRSAEAEDALRQALQGCPDWLPARNGLAALLRRDGRVDEAIVELRTALVARPDDADTHNNLGNALQSKGLLAEAIAEYETALRLEPRHDLAHRNLRVALREGLRQNGDAPDLLTRLAWELVSDDDTESTKQALDLAQRACQVTAFRDARALDALAAAHWAAGHERKAIRTARQALRLVSTGQPDEAADIRRRLEHYQDESGHPGGSRERR